MRMLRKLLELLRVENNLNKMAYLMFALRDVSQVSGFLEVV